MLVSALRAQRVWNVDAARRSRMGQPEVAVQAVGPSLFFRSFYLYGPAIQTGILFDSGSYTEVKAYGGSSGQRG